MGAGGAGGAGAEGAGAGGAGAGKARGARAERAGAGTGGEGDGEAIGGIGGGEYEGGSVGLRSTGRETETLERAGAVAGRAAGAVENWATASNSAVVDFGVSEPGNFFSFGSGSTRIKFGIF